ncbi:hypothetical protein WEI85_00115 [Actinomycetes bacterium KLBMP 9797]
MTTDIAVTTATTCDETPEALTVEQAHSIMQEHIRCDIASCRQRHAARALLVRDGRYVLAAR